MIEETLRNPDVTHILMLEPGVKVHPGLLWELFANPTDIVAVPCFDDEKPFHPNIYKAAEIGYNKIVDFDVDPKIRKIQVDACDPGCVLIARHVIESVGKFRYNDDYFRSDMFLFTEKAKQMGFEITATTVVHCHRIKTLEVGYNFFKEYRAIEQLKNKKTDDTKNLFQ